MTAITGVGPLLAITAVKGSVQPFVRLLNNNQGAAGNQPITETVANSGFTTTGMSGGGANDCPRTTPCEVDADCASPLLCLGTPKTCGP